MTVFGWLLCLAVAYGGYSLYKRFTGPKHLASAPSEQRELHHV